VRAREHEHVRKDLERIGVALLARLAVDDQTLVAAYRYDVGNATECCGFAR
jgi:hypothetical protein